MIGRVVKGGAAERSGQLHPGDEVLEVNGLRLKGKSVHDICDRLCQMTGTLTFVIIPKSASGTPAPQNTVNTSGAVPGASGGTTAVVSAQNTNVGSNANHELNKVGSEAPSEQVVSFQKFNIVTRDSILTLSQCFEHKELKTADSQLTL